MITYGTRMAWPTAPPLRSRGSDFLFVAAALLAAAVGVHAVQDAELVVYLPPSHEPAFEDCSVEVNGQPVFVYCATVNRSAANHGIAPETVGFAGFDFAGTVQVKVTAKQDLKAVKVGPQSYGIVPAVAGRSVRFQLAQPRKLCLEWNGSDQRPLFLFANGIEQYPGGVPRPGQDRVRYFGPGAHAAGVIRPQSGETIYLAGGAIVYGRIAADGVRGVRILGRGILDGSKWKPGETSLLTVNNSADVEIRGLILRDSPCWTVVPTRCERVTVADVKILNYRKNSDGINAVNSRQVTVEDCFVRNYDDSIAVKALHPDPRDVEDITVRNCVVWCDWGFALGMTYEARVANIRRLRFQNCDVLHGMACRGALGVKNGDRAMVSDVRFENIRIEDARVQLLELVVDRDMWSKDEQRGRIQGVVFRDIALTGGVFVPSTLAGHDTAHGIEEVVFENLRIHGKLITNAEEGRIRVNAHVKDVRFLPGK